jgi:hypothetical protein
MRKKVLTSHSRRSTYNTQQNSKYKIYKVMPYFYATTILWTNTITRIFPHSYNEHGEVVFFFCWQKPLPWDKLNSFKNFLRLWLPGPKYLLIFWFPKDLDNWMPNQNYTFVTFQAVLAKRIQLPSTASNSPKF